MESTPKSLEGYIHDVSDILVAKSGTRYFHFQLQQEINGQSRVVCFAPEKRATLKERERSRLPVHINDVAVGDRKRKKLNEKDDFIMTKKTKILDKKNLTFAWKALMPDKPKVLSVCDIVHTTQVGDRVSVRAKVFSKGKKETVYSTAFNKTFTKCSLVILDSSGAITLTLWENFIDEVAENFSYMFDDLKVGHFKEQCVNSTFKTKIVAICDEIEEPGADCKCGIELMAGEEKVSVFEGTIMGVDVAKASICFNCKTRFPESDAQFQRCAGCSLSVMTGKMASQLKANIFLHCSDDEQFTGRYVCSTTVLKELFSALSELREYYIGSADISTVSSDEITATLLQLDKVLCVVSLKDKELKSIIVGDSPPTPMDTVLASAAQPTQVSGYGSGPPPAQVKICSSGPPPAQVSGYAPGPPPAQVSGYTSGPPPAQVTSCSSRPPSAQVSGYASGPPPAQVTSCSSRPLPMNAAAACEAQPTLDTDLSLQSLTAEGTSLSTDVLMSMVAEAASLPLPKSCN